MDKLSPNDSDNTLPQPNINVPSEKNENVNPNDNKTHKQVEIRQNNNNAHLSFDINNNHQKLMPLHSESMIDSKKINSCINKRCCLILGASLILVVLPPVMAIIYEEALFPNHKASDVYHDFGIVSFVVAGTIVGLVLLWHVIDHKKLWCKLMMNLIPEVIILFVLELILDKEYDDKEEKRRKRGRIIFYGASLLMSCVITLINNLCCKETQEAQRKLIDNNAKTIKKNAVKQNHDHVENNHALSYLLSNTVKKSDVNQRLLSKKQKCYTNLKIDYNNNTYSNKQEKKEETMSSIETGPANQNTDILSHNPNQPKLFNNQVESKNSIDKTQSSRSRLQVVLEHLVAIIMKFWPAQSCPNTYKARPNKPLTLQLELVKLGGDIPDLEEPLRKAKYSQKDIDYAFDQMNQKLFAIRNKYPKITIGEAITLLDQQQKQELKEEQEKTKREKMRLINHLMKEEKLTYDEALKKINNDIK